MSFKPDPTWDHATLETNIKVCSLMPLSTALLMSRCAGFHSVQMSNSHLPFLQAHEQAFTEKPATFMARIQLEYEMQR